VPTPLSSEQLARDLAVRDLTDPEQGPHALQQLVKAAVSGLANGADPGASSELSARRGPAAARADRFGKAGPEVRWCRGPRVVPIEDNYDHLLIGPDAVSRDTRYTRYVDDRRMLRSHSTAMIPPALRALAAGGRTADRPDEDVLLVCPGVVYRRDAIDWQHTGTPHQLDLWRVSRSSTMTTPDLEEMIAVLADALVPGYRYRSEPRVHPYTLEGRQVDILSGDRWVEVWECGLAHPGVLERAGLRGWSGLALGMGLDRLLMLRKGIPDIRLLRSSDPRVVGQMGDLDPYASVSSMPPVRRDLSIAVGRDDEDEDLGGRVRDALGTDADAVEEVTLISRTSFHDLLPAARNRLGMTPDLRNVLVRVVLRHLERTLTDEEANALRDRIYAALHRGTSYQWASRSEHTPPAK
jgi:phenylalanyl-tRNA synthetase alpha chain